MNWCEKSDGDLVTAFASSGAQEAFEELVRRHATMVFRTCRRVTGSHQDAEDATQAVFSTLVLKAACLGSHSSLAGWLYSTAWHVSRRYRRRELTRRQRELRAQPVMLVEAGEAGDEGLSEEVYRALEMLPPDYRDAIVLHHLEGLSLAQVAEVQDCPLGTVAARLSRGRALMRERLNWRGIVMSDAAITALILAEMANETAASGIARNAAMAAASTTAGAEALTLASTAAGGAAGGVATAVVTATGGAAALFAGLRASQWAAVLLISLGLSTTTATVVNSLPAQPTHTQLTGSSEAERVTRSNGAMEESPPIFDPYRAAARWRASSNSVPEPAGLAIFALGGLLLRRIR